MDGFALESGDLKDGPWLTIGPYRQTQARPRDEAVCSSKAF